MVKVQRAPDAATLARSRRRQDIGGLLLFFLGAAGLLCLCWPQNAPLPALIDGGLRLLAGSGAYAVPLILMLAGAMFLVGYERLSLTASSLGTLLLFLVFVTARHLALVPNPARWNEADARAAGGVLGGLFGSVAHSLLGRPISALLLVTLSAVAIVLLADRPFADMLRRVWGPARLPDRDAPEAEPRPARRAARAAEAETPALPPATAANGGETERAERAARIAERAVESARAARGAIPVPPADDGADDDPEPPSTQRTLFNLFSLARRGEQDAPDAPDAAPEPEPDPEPAPAPEKTRPKREPKAAAPPPPPEDDAPVLVPIPNTEYRTPEPPFVLPPLTLLQDSPPAVSKRSQAELTEKVQIIERTLEQFNIGANVMEVASGPSVTRYEIQLAPGIKVSKIVSLADNLAMSLAAIDVRVEAPIPGKAAIGVEVPNATPVTVSLREVLDTEAFRLAPSRLTVALGKDVSGLYKYADLTKMPHLLIGGSTNSGKSVCLNVLIASLVYRNTPADVQLLMIDPKRVELSLWDGIPHLMHPVVKDVKQASGIFRAALREMDRRYDLFAALGTRNIDGYNQKVGHENRLPYLVLIVDELADLMIQQGPEVETSICRLAQLARATGIHLIIATQRPSVDIVTGTIKANISSRIAFAVASQVDSRTILDMNGAERLIGRGDMLFMPIDAAKPLRIQGCYLSESETNALVSYLKEQGKPQFAFTLGESGGGSGAGGGSGEEDVDDAFFEQAVRLVVNNGQASTSMLQRRFRIGYTRAARIVEMMEEKGVVGPLNGAKPREILVSKDDVESMFNPGGPLPSVADYEDE